MTNIWKDDYRTVYLDGGACVVESGVPVNFANNVHVIIFQCEVFEVQVRGLLWNNQLIYMLYHEKDYGLYSVFLNVSHVLRWFFDEISSLKNRLKNVTNIWKHTVYIDVFIAYYSYECRYHGLNHIFFVNKWNKWIVKWEFNHGWSWVQL